MDKQEANRARRFILTAFAATVVILVTIVCFALLWENRPISPSLTINNLEQAMCNDDYQVLLGDTCYLLQQSNPLGDFCRFLEWRQDKPDIEPRRILTIRLAEAYELAFYEEGWAKGYDGYCSSKYREVAWYKVPDNSASAISDYVREAGIVQEMYLGPSGWFELVE